MKSFVLGFGFWISFVTSVFASDKTSLTAQLDGLSSSDYAWIAQRIFQNEANQNPDYLTHWNAGEEFPSLGIGHFIWFPQSAKQKHLPFVETFPAMRNYVSQFQTPPAWLTDIHTAPWQNKAEFDQAWSSAALAELRQWLLATAPWQAKFIVSQFGLRWQAHLATLNADQQTPLKTQLERLIQTRAGLFAVIDYYNFKGLGLNTKEQYQQQGWGLMDVMLAMPEPSYLTTTDALTEFVDSAKKILQKRVSLAPPARHEEKWLPGWYKRLDGYTQNRF